MSKEVEKEQQEEKLDASGVVDKLLNQIKGLVLDVAILQDNLEGKQEIIDKQNELIKAYEDKEKAAKK